MACLRIIKRPNERGFSLTELAIVLGVVGLIVSAIWFAAGNASELQKENNAVSEMQSIVQNINNVMAGQSFSGNSLTDITSSMITAQNIPNGFVDVQNNTTADNPWSLGSTVGGSYTGLKVWSNPQAPVGKTFRISFYEPTYKGCMALLLQGTSCQAGLLGCPIEVWTGGKGKANPTSSCSPNQTACPGSSLGSQPPGWQSMGVNVASTMCAANSLSSGSVEFDYSL
jgi:prepilin-type N-terminal cleavage/methylation domain-containing protein